MTTRLKKQLANLGVDASSARSNESFCLIGTPLPPLEKSKDTGEFVPLWKQEVRDEKGRRRLHGAFTGGFSAGYFNTVGSKEGWTPSTFVSSRSDRSKAKQARPEDFMDEEDLAELAASRSLVDTTEELDITGGKGKGTEDAEDEESNSMARKLEAALLPPPSDSVGAKILRKMGWKVGQGIGPRLNYRQKRLQDAALGLAGDNDADIDPEEGGEESKHTYAPRDTPLLLPSRKRDTHGHGYQPGMSLYEGSGTKNGSAPSGPNLSAGFGLGALNDADEDDIDVYDSGMARGKTRMAYDAMDVDDQETIRIGGSRKGPQQHGSLQARVSSSGGSFRDGRPVLNGFVLASQPVAEDKWYPLPEVPKGWKPDPTRVWRNGSQEASTSKAMDPQNDTKTFQEWKKGVSANERGSILGETPLPASTRSVFEYMSQKDRERLQRAASSVGSDPKDTPTSQSIPSPAPVPASIHIPRTEPYIAKAALFGFQPYQSDPIKHDRYNIYLNSQSHIDGSHPALRPAQGQSIEAFNKEVSDYAQSAAVFKPLSGAMAGRFTSAAIIESGPKAHEGLYMPDLNKPAEETSAPEQPKEEEKVAEDPKENAARHGMYGPMTRSIKKWAPARLLCKRFGVKDPEPEADVEDELPTASSSAAPAPPKAEPLPIEPATEVTSQSVDEDGKKPTGPRDLANVGLGDDEFQAQDVLTYERPSLDVFKAIFASDSEDSDDDEATNEAPAEQTHAQQPVSIPRPNASSDVGSISSIANLAPVPATAPLPPSKSKSTESASLDLVTFKPTFVSRQDRHGDTTDGQSREKDKNKNKIVDKSLISFDGEDGEDIGLGAPKAKKRKDKSKHRDKDQDKDRHKKRKMITTMHEDDDDIWVEKPIPKVVMAAETAQVEAAPQAPKGRKTAADFM